MLTLLGFQKASALVVSRITLYQCIRRHGDELDAAGLIHRPVEGEVLERFMACGDLHHGFARIYCDQCRHDYLLAYSCKARYFCSSCHQKRMLAYGAWLEGNPLPLVLYVQTFGDLVTFNPHIHALVADGVFLPSGTFRVLPPLPEAALREALRHKVLDFLCAEGVLDAGLADRMRQWRHSGFSVHNRIRTQAADAEGRQRLARYMIRCPFALEKMRYDDQSGMVIYRSKLHATLKRNYQLMPALKWLRLLLNHVPDKYEHLVRYYGYYSNRARGARRPARQEHDTSATIVIDEPLGPADPESLRSQSARVRKLRLPPSSIPSGSRTR